MCELLFLIIFEVTKNKVGTISYKYRLGMRAVISKVAKPKCAPFHAYADLECVLLYRRHCWIVP